LFRFIKNQGFYFQLNSIFFLLLATGLVYLYLFDPSGGTGYPESDSIRYFGVETQSTGLTRCFHQLVHGNVTRAYEINEHCLRIATWYMTMLIMRFALLLFHLLVPSIVKRLWLIDALLSAVMLAISFKPLWHEIVIH
jgi:hypothetical protein